jgi:hypothetical protein
MRYFQDNGACSEHEDTYNEDMGEGVEGETRTDIAADDSVDLKADASAGAVNLNHERLAKQRHWYAWWHERLADYYERSSSSSSRSSSSSNIGSGGSTVTCGDSSGNSGGGREELPYHLHRALSLHRLLFQQEQKCWEKQLLTGNHEHADVESSTGDLSEAAPHMHYAHRMETVRISLTRVLTDWGVVDELWAGLPHHPALLLSCWREVACAAEARAAAESHAVAMEAVFVFSKCGQNQCSHCMRLHNSATACVFAQFDPSPPQQHPAVAAYSKQYGRQSEQHNAADDGRGVELARQRARVGSLLQVMGLYVEGEALVIRAAEYVQSRAHYLHQQVATRGGETNESGSKVGSEQEEQEQEQLRWLLGGMYTSIANGLYMRAYGSLPDLDGAVVTRLCAVSSKAMQIWSAVGIGVSDEGDEGDEGGSTGASSSSPLSPSSSAAALLLLCYRGLGCGLFWKQELALASVVLQRAITLAEGGEGVHDELMAIEMRCFKVSSLVEPVLLQPARNLPLGHQYCPQPCNR